MEYENIIDSIPLPLLFFLTSLFSFITFGLGFKIGRCLIKGSHEKVNSSKDNMIAPMLGLLAFVLAFTFGIAGNRYDSRRLIVLEEGNAIGTTYLRAGYLPEEYKNTIRALLKEYVIVRLDAIKTQKYQEAIVQSEIIQSKLWDQTILLVKNGSESAVIGLFINSLNELIDLHQKRLLLVFDMKIPDMNWFILFFLMILSIGAMGYVAGLKNSRDFGLNLLVIISFTSVIYMISDLDHPQKGYLKVSQKPLINTLKMMNQ